MVALSRSTTTTRFVEGSTTPWMSPELWYPGQFGLMDGRQTKESDCFALGMVIYEVLSGKRPFATDKDSVIARMILDGHRPRRPQGKEGGLFTDDIWGALELCWKDQPQDRISVSAILRPLEGHPPLLRPSPDADAETGSDDQSDAGSGMFFSVLPLANL